MCYFSKLEHTAHYKGKNQNADKTNFHLHMSLVYSFSNEGIDFDLQMLRQPENVVLNDFKQQRAAALDPQLISQYEELVCEWINTIEAIVNDTTDERWILYAVQ